MKGRLRQFLDLDGNRQAGRWFSALTNSPDSVAGFARRGSDRTAPPDHWDTGSLAHSLRSSARLPRRRPRWAEDDESVALRDRRELRGVRRWTVMVRR